MGLIAMTEDELIALADKNFGDWRSYRCSNPASPTVIETCEEFWSHGASDESSGDADTFGHFYRVDRWIVWTDSQGFNTLETFETEGEAEAAFSKHETEYYTGGNDGDPMRKESV